MPTNAFEQRLTEIEIKLTDTEDTVDELNKQLFRQQQQIDLLAREVLELKRNQVRQPGGAPLSPEDERPPHY